MVGRTRECCASIHFKVHIARGHVVKLGEGWGGRKRMRSGVPLQKDGSTGRGFRFWGWWGTPAKHRSLGKHLDVGEMDATHRQTKPRKKNGGWVVKEAT